MAKDKGKTKRHPELQFEKKNQNIQKLPSYVKVHKRPIPHAAVASPYAGASVPKIVYVSTKTPFMSAVKRVQKLLRQAEKRSTSKVDLLNNKISEKEKFARLTEGQDALKREEVFVKATGRAIDKAMNVGKWFQERDEEYSISVKTGSVLVVDDIEEDEDAKRKAIEKQLPAPHNETEPATEKSGLETPSKKRKRNAKETDSADTELPETRTRWTNVVEIAVTLK